MRTIITTRRLVRDRRARRPRRGFTIVELLVVVSIIALLLAMMLPMLGRARENARLAMCASNLRQYANAQPLYANDNDGRFMKMVKQWSNRAYPDYIRRDTHSNPAYLGEWGIDILQPYVDAMDDSRKAVYGIAHCPSIDAALMDRFIKERNYGSNHPFLEFQYTYFGGINLMSTSDYVHSAPQDLVGQDLDANKILITDILYFDQSDGAWRYNHGQRGWAFNEVSYMPWDRGATPAITGVNQAYGDAHVEWKRRDDFTYIDLMRTPAAYPAGAVGFASSGGDTCYY